MKNQLTTQLREFYLSQTEDYNPGKQILRKLGEMFYLLEAEGFTYIFETKYHTSKWRTDILHKVHQGYTVQGNTYKVEQQVTMTPYSLTEFAKNAIWPRVRVRGTHSCRILVPQPGNELQFTSG